MTPICKWLPKLALVATSVIAISATAGAAKKSNILVIFGDDFGQTNISAYPSVIGAVFVESAWCIFFSCCRVGGNRRNSARQEGAGIDFIGHNQCN